jgi:hypothetical protein
MQYFSWNREPVGPLYNNLGFKICLHVQFWLKSDHNERLMRDNVAYMAHTVKFYEKAPSHVIHNQGRS